MNVSDYETHYDEDGELSGKHLNNDSRQNVHNAGHFKKNCITYCGVGLYNRQFALLHLYNFKMASIVKVQKVNAQQAARKRKHDDDMDVMIADKDTSPPEKKLKNKQRVLLLSSRGVTHRMRHLMNDLEALLPQVKKGKFSLSTTTSRGSQITQIRSLILSLSFTSSRSWQTFIIAITHFI